MNVCFSGIDGSGKTTYIDELTKVLMELNGVTVVKHDPMKKGDLVPYLGACNPEWHSSFDDETVATTISAGYAFDLLKAMVEMEDKCINLIHRGPLCCKVYSVLTNADSRIIERICSVKKPDLTVLIETDPEIAFQRILQRKSKQLSWKETAGQLEKAALIFSQECNMYSGEILHLNGNSSDNIEYNVLLLKRRIMDMLSKKK